MRGCLGGVLVGVIILFGLLSTNARVGKFIVQSAPEKFFANQRDALKPTIACVEGFTGNARCSADGNYLEEEYRQEVCTLIGENGEKGRCECRLILRQTSCPSGCQNGMCLELTVATLEDSYNVGEDVDLTDPPVVSEKDVELIEERNILDGIGKIFDLLPSMQAVEVQPVPEVILFNEASRLARRNYIFQYGKDTTIELGKLMVTHYDDFERKRSWEDYSLVADGVQYKVYFIGNPYLTSGTEITAIGKSLGNEMAVTNYNI